MEFCNKTYFTNLIGFSPDISNLNLGFKNQLLEEEFRKTFMKVQKNNFIKSIIFFCIPLIFSLVNSITNNKQMVRSSYINLSGIIADIILAIISKNLENNYNNLQIFRYIRFILLYINIAISVIFPVNPLADTPLRVAYAFILYNNFIQNYFLGFNFVFYIFIIILNSVVLYLTQITRNLGNTFLLPEILLNIFYYYLSYLIKRSEVYNQKVSFFESYKNQNYLEYIKNLVDALNTMIICVQNDDILFLNSYVLKYFNNRKLMMNHNSIFSNKESKEQENLLGKNEKISEIKNKVNLFFDSLTLNICCDNNFKENEKLTDIMKKIYMKELYNSNDFQKLGYFKIEFPEECYFEIHARKLRYKEEALEMLIYDLTHIKQAEARDIESKYKHKILAKIAHEFKTPLITIISLINRVGKYNNDEYLDLIKRNLKNINNLSNYTLYLINDIIQYVSDFINIKLCKNEVNLQELLEFCYNILKTLVECNENKNDKIKTFLKIDENISKIQIFTDENRLKQIILNLVSNAYKFTLNGFIKLEAKYKQDSKIVEIIVKDTGIGIKEEDYNHIFKDHIQFNINQEYNCYGSGLGLLIVKNLSNLLNIKTGFKSSYKKGSKFYIRINCINETDNNSLDTVNYNSKVLFSKPLNESIFINNNEIYLTVPNKSCEIIEHVSESEIISTIRKDYTIKKYIPYYTNNGFEDLDITHFYLMIGGSVLDNNKFKIVVVDDYKLVRENSITLLNNLLYKMNANPGSYEIIECSDGIDLLETVKLDISNRIKLILTDENMEYLNGSEAVKIIRNLEHRKKIPNYQIVSVTAFDDTETKKRILDSGVNLVISKPCTKSELSNILNKYFSTYVNK